MFGNRGSIPGSITFARLAVLVTLGAAIGFACGSPASDNSGSEEGGDGGSSSPGSGGKGAGGKSGGKGGSTGSGGSPGSGGKGAGGAEYGNGGSGEGGASAPDAATGDDAAEGGAGGEEPGAGGGGGTTSTGGNGGVTGGGGTGGKPVSCTMPYPEGPGLPGTCGNSCMRCTGDNPTIEKIYTLTPPDGANKVSQDYFLDSEKADPDRTPVAVKAAIYSLKGAVYWVSDLDVDCDGKPTPGKCQSGNGDTYLMDTAFHGPSGALAAAVTPYVVIPNNFALGAHGLTGGQVIAVVFGGKIQYAVLGDTGPPQIIGEASYACAEKLGIDPSPTMGGINGRSVTYIAFTGAGTVPKNIEDQAETKALGEKLMAKFLQDNGM